MKHRSLVLALLTALLLMAFAGAASAAPASITLIAPAKGSELTQTTAHFSWYAVPNAAKYTFKLLSADGTQKRVIKNLSANCYNNVCGVIHDPQFYSWTWQEGEVYKWKVIAKKANGKTIAKAGSKFVVNLMADDIPLLNPENHHSALPGTSAFISWQRDVRFDQYRIIFKGNGQKNVGTWTAAYSLCAEDTCGAALMMPFTTGKYKWRIEGRRQLVSPSVKSPWQVIYSGVPSGT